MGEVIRFGSRAPVAATRGRRGAYCVVSRVTGVWPGKRGYFIMGTLGWGELIAIGLLAFLLFGPKRLPELARSLGEGIREFKKSISGAVEESPKEPQDAKKLS